MHIDSEMRQLRAIAAMDALETLFDLVPPDEVIDCRHVAALLGVTHQAVRGALPKAARMLPCNDAPG